MKPIKILDKAIRNATVRIFGLFVALMTLTMTACEDALDTKVFSQISPENFFQTEADFNAAVITLYNPFGTDWGANDVGNGIWYNHLYNANVAAYYIRSEAVTDEMELAWTADLNQFNWGPATFGDDAVYAKIRFVARATSTIQSMSESTAVPDAVKNRYIAEAKTLRAWMMYVLYDFYGPVNAKWDPETLTDSEVLPRPSEEAYLAQIEKDLTEAIPNLDDRYNGDAGNWGRAAKGLARMILLKLYMNTKQWTKAEPVAREIMSMGYSLMQEYHNVFIEERNNEVIFAIACDVAVGARNWYPQHLFPGDFASSSLITRGAGWYSFRMPWEFYDTYDPSDKRRNTIIASYTNTSGETSGRDNGLEGPIPLKYVGISGPGPEYAADWVIFRYADVLLSLAEIINELNDGPTTEAYDLVGEVRTRAGLNNFTEGMTQTQFRDALLAERGRELYAEGVRRQDLIRHGKFIEYAQDRGVSLAQSHHVRFPIPNAAILEGGKEEIVSQNPGYN